MANALSQYYLSNAFFLLPHITGVSRKSQCLSWVLAEEGFPSY